MTAVGSLRVMLREQAGRGASRALRRTAMIPGVVYGENKENVNVSVDPRDILKGLNNAAFYSTIYELNLNGKTERTLVRAVQFHPVTDAPIHVDFWRVGKNSKIHLNVPIVFLNENKAPGIKKGGMLNVVLHSLDITCLADNIPEQITVDLEGKEIGTSIHLTDLELPKGAKATHPDRDNTIATIAAPVVAKDAAEGAA